MVLRTLLRGIERRDLWRDHQVVLTADGLEALRETRRSGPVVWALVRDPDRVVLRMGADDDLVRPWLVESGCHRDVLAWATGADAALGPRRAERYREDLLFWARLAGVPARIWALRTENAATWLPALNAYFCPLWESFRAVCALSAGLHNHGSDVCALGAARGLAEELHVALPELERSSRRLFWW